MFIEQVTPDQTNAASLICEAESRSGLGLCKAMGFRETGWMDDGKSERKL